jgi:hypothetical protein
VDQHLKAQIVSMSDETLIAIVENNSDEYTPDALAFARKEVSRRGGIEFLKERLLQVRDLPPAEISQEPETSADDSGEIGNRLKKSYWVFVLAAYILFIYVIRGSLWVYWLCVFVMIAFWIKIFINAKKLTPEEEYAEIAKEMAKHPPKDDQHLNDHHEEKP